MHCLFEAVNKIRNRLHIVAVGDGNESRSHDLENGGRAKTDLGGRNRKQHVVDLSEKKKSRRRSRQKLSALIGLLFPAVIE